MGEGVESTPIPQQQASCQTCLANFNAKGPMYMATHPWELAWCGAKDGYCAVTDALSGRSRPNDMRQMCCINNNHYPGCYNDPGIWNQLPCRT